MCYLDIYERFKTAPIYVSRNSIRDEVLRCLGGAKVKIIRTHTINPSECRGMYFSATNTKHQFVALHGQHVIAVAAGLSRCWERLILVKELMHMLDGAHEATDSGDSLEQVLTELQFQPSSEMSPQGKSEVNALYMALGLLVPEYARVAACTEWMAMRAEGRDDADYQIAKKFRIPEAYVRFLFTIRYVELVEFILARHNHKKVSSS